MQNVVVSGDSDSESWGLDCLIKKINLILILSKNSLWLWRVCGILETYDFWQNIHKWTVLVQPYLVKNIQKPWPLP